MNETENATIMRLYRSQLSTWRNGGSKLTTETSDPNEFTRQLSMGLFPLPAGMIGSDR